MKYIITESQKKRLINKLIEEELREQKKNFDKLSYLTKTDSNKGTEITKRKNWKNVYDNLVNSNKIKKNEPMLILLGDTQTMFYTKDGQNLIKTFKVSTGVNGFGNLPDSAMTNTGLMKIGKKIQAPNLYQVLVYKKPVDSILGPNKNSSRVDNQGKKHTAEVLTGLVELIGLEDSNKNVYDRNIYIHGTNRENLLGRKASGGCVRVSNTDILFLIKNLAPNTKLYIQA